VKQELDNFIELQKSTPEGSYDIQTFLKNYNSKIVIGDPKPPAFLCLERDNNIYDLEELKEDYSRRCK